MSEDKTWVHRAFPTLAPGEAERLVDGLRDPERYALHSLVNASLTSRELAEMARIYSTIAANLIAQNARQKAGPHQRRWLICHLAGGDFSKGLGARVKRWLNENQQACEFFGFHAGTDVETTRKRNSAVTELLKEIRHAIKNGERPYVLSVQEEEELKNWFAFDDADSSDSKAGEFSPSVE